MKSVAFYFFLLGSLIAVGCSEKEDDEQSQPVLEIALNPGFISNDYQGGKRVMSPREEKYFVCTALGSQCVVSLAPIGYSEVCADEARGVKVKEKRK